MANAFTWGTKDKFGQTFGVALTRYEQKIIEGRRNMSPIAKENAVFKRQVTKRAQARKQEVTLDVRLVEQTRNNLIGLQNDLAECAIITGKHRQSIKWMIVWLEKFLEQTK